MSTGAVAIVCKTPMSGSSKTRLSPPLRPDECAALSACFIRDLAATIQSLAEDGDVTNYAVYTPRGSEASRNRPDPSKMYANALRAVSTASRLRLPGGTYTSR